MVHTNKDLAVQLHMAATLLAGMDNPIARIAAKLIIQVALELLAKED